MNKLKESNISQQVKATDPDELTWRRKAQAPVPMSSSEGSVTYYDDVAYFSQGHNVYSFTYTEDLWGLLKQCKYKNFGMAVVNDRLTTIGGEQSGTTIKNLFCVSGKPLKEWEEIPLMPTARATPAVVRTSAHLIVAGGRGQRSLSTVEVLNVNTFQWFSAKSSPEAFSHPHITLCSKYLYLSQNKSIFSCSVEDLLKSREFASTITSAVWKRLADIPVPYNASLTTLKWHVLAIGGSEEFAGGKISGAIHRYNKNSDSWIVVGEMPTPRFNTLAANTHFRELVVVGGYNHS